ncbi:MAG: hypothetical protein OEW13_05570 [Nitrospira sp.]|nr:hypothetical protein [Nitrospira sp.]MDH5347361.1 hypothetical protein [Nitrospira sp.]
MSSVCSVRKMIHLHESFLFMKDAKPLVLTHVSMSITAYALVQENWATQWT